MENMEAIRESIEKVGVGSNSSSFYFPSKVDYDTTPKTMKGPIDTPNHSNASNPNFFHPKASLATSAYLPNEIQGMNSSYEIISQISLEIARDLQAQTGLVVPFEP